MSEHISNLVESKLKKIKEEKNVFDTGKVIRLKDYIIEVLFVSMLTLQKSYTKGLLTLLTLRETS